MPIIEKGNGTNNDINRLIPIDSPTHIKRFKIEVLALLIVVNA